jgi:hypothetical protein
MYDGITCLVDRDGNVYSKDGNCSYSEIAKAFGLDVNSCLKYKFELSNRSLFRDFDTFNAPFEAKALHNRAARKFFDRCASTPKKLIVFVRRGNFNEKTLTFLLTPSASEEYNKASALALKARLKTTAPAAYGKAEGAYHEALATAWIKLFKKKSNRIGVWKN